MINCREQVDASLNKGFFQNKFLFISLGILFVLQTGVIYLPFAQQVIETTSLSFAQHLPILVNVLLLFTIVEVEKRISKTWIKRKEREAFAGN